MEGFSFEWLELLVSGSGEIKRTVKAEDDRSAFRQRFLPVAAQPDDSSHASADTGSDHGANPSADHGSEGSSATCSNSKSGGGLLRIVVADDRALIIHVS